MAGPGNQVLQLEEFIQPDSLATQIVNFYDQWVTAKNVNAAEKQELHNYLFATDTTKTANKTLPWKNSTTIPKLTQIRDTLEANYMDALFPSENFFTWEGDNETAEEEGKRLAIINYMKHKLMKSEFKDQVVRRLVLDWIDEGNCFATVDYVHQKVKDPNTDEDVDNYVGPKAIRISPKDIVFNIMAPSFASAPKIVRSVLSLGDLALLIEEHPEQGYLADVFSKAMEERRVIKQMLGSNDGDRYKDESMRVEGFGSIWDYYASDYVEILTFYGNIFDLQKGSLRKDVIIAVMDRAHVVRDVPNPSWVRGSPIVHSGWRDRPDNLLAMGPLDNLVGMQYRIDHLENAKADAWDMFSHPVMKVRGDVEDFEYGPGERIYVSEEGDVDFMRPDPSALTADNQIAILEAKMEEMAGAPKQAAGFRTPGEKTKFEVATLDNAAGRLFLNKTKKFEQMVEALINMMLESAVRNIGTNELIRVTNDQDNVVDFQTITKEDLTAAGRLKPRGAQHFATKATLLQNLNQFAVSGVGQDQGVRVHISGLRMAKLMEQLLEVEKFDLVEENIQVIENAETQRIAQTAQQQVAVEAETEAGATPDELFLDEEGNINEEVFDDDEEI